MYMMKIFVFGIHTPQHWKRELGWAFLTLLQNICWCAYASHTYLCVSREVHLMSPTIICRKTGFQKGRIMWKKVRMTWLVWLRSSTMLNCCFHCYKYRNGWTLKQRLCDPPCLAINQSLWQVQSNPHLQFYGHQNLIMAQELKTFSNDRLDSCHARMLYSFTLLIKRLDKTFPLDVVF